MIDVDAFIKSQIRFNARIVSALDEAGVVSRKEFAAALRASAERLPEGKERKYLIDQALGITDGLPPDLTVIDGGKDSD